jgi:hypothetical protein
LETITSELFDVRRLQGTLKHDKSTLTAAVVSARNKLESLYSIDPEFRSILEEEQSTTTELRTPQKRKRGLRIKFD